jgi:Flp pilus assembly protein TadB
MIAASALVCGLGFGLGVLGIVYWVRRSDADASGGRPWRPQASGSRNELGRAGLAVAIATVVGVLTGWPVAVPITALAAYGVPKLFGRTSGSVSIAKVEAIAAWTEMLQGTLAASAGLGQAIISTAPLSPVPVRGAATRLSSRLVAGMHPREALLQFADELADPCSDRVVCALLLATTARAQRLGELLAALADSTRDEVALRLRIETSRASVRSGVRTVLVFSLAFAGALTLLAHSYLEPFGSVQGQVALLVVGGLYATGLTSMVALARPTPPIRLLGRDVVER